MKTAEQWFEISKQTPASVKPLPLNYLEALEKLAEETLLKFIRDIQVDAIASALDNDRQWCYSHDEIEASCGGELAVKVRRKVMDRRERIDTERN